jgi:hypothetical protein
MTEELPPPVERTLEDVEMEGAMREAKAAILENYGDDLNGRQAGHVALLVAEILHPAVKRVAYASMADSLAAAGDWAEPFAEAIREVLSAVKSTKEVSTVDEVDEH